MIGREVGNYRILDRIGDGGMGSVYRAVDRMLDREVAIKVLRADLTRKESLVERFKQEAKALARLSHPRIATLHGLEQHGDELFMIMEFVRGDTLEAIVERSGRITWPRACELCMAVLDALDHAHDMGVVHRDIKPANVMLAHNGAVKVMDFGIARMLGRSRQTQVGHSVGTPMYMAPEQLRGHEVDARTDIYAVGAVLFELITGRMAFDADSDYALMMKKLNDPPPPASEFVPDVPNIVDAIVFRAMANEPAHRFPNAMAFSQELARAIEAAPASARPNAAKRSTPAPETRLAVDTPSHAIADDAPATRDPRGPVETRLAPPKATVVQASDIAETRVVVETSEHARPDAMAASASDARPRWTDWRVYASAGALFAAVAVGVRLARTEPEKPVKPTGDSTIVAPLGPVTPASSNAGEDLASLRVPAASGPVSPPVATPPAQPAPRPTPPPAADKRRERDTPPSSRDRGTGDERSTPPRPEPPREVVDAPTPVTPAPAPVENAAATRDAIRAALVNALGDLAQPSGAESLLQGGAKSDWVSLAREGRVSAGAPQGLDISVQGAQATATFSSDVNVRSPFGANRRRSAQFTAEMQRDGNRWRVTSVRPASGLSLK
ncbi:MAG TPA: serine/threonine-protein kinase [Gemmatimonas sp.]|uniref:serine/threonine-protein kinase n=1 Tax=Gemmatimonas sp. TaxID=1962908 RepID=UPI002ED91903